MNAQEYPAQHFDQIARLVRKLADLPVQLLEHGYSYESFGSWWSILRFKGVPFRIVHDGNGAEVIVERSATKKPPYEWSEFSRHKMDLAAAGVLERHVMDTLVSASDTG